MIGGLPRTLTFLGLVGFTGTGAGAGTTLDASIGVGIGGLSHEFAQFVEECLPMNVRLLRIGAKYYTVWSGRDESSNNMDGEFTDGMEEERKPRIGNALSGRTSGSGAGSSSSSSSSWGLSGAGMGGMPLCATGKKRLEEWPERRAQMHMREWLESLECEEAVFASDDLECLD